MYKYETLIVAKPDISDEDLSTLRTRLMGRLEEKGGREIAFQNWGKRKLAYEIRDNMKGTFLYFRYLGKGGEVASIENLLGITESVLRFISVRLDEKINPDTFDFETDKAGITPFGVRKPNRTEEKREGEEGEGSQGDAESAQPAESAESESTKPVSEPEDLEVEASESDEAEKEAE